MSKRALPLVLLALVVLASGCTTQSNHLHESDLEEQTEKINSHTSKAVNNSLVHKYEILDIEVSAICQSNSGIYERQASIYHEQNPQEFQDSHRIVLNGIDGLYMPDCDDRNKTDERMVDVGLENLESRHVIYQEGSVIMNKTETCHTVDLDERDAEIFMVDKIYESCFKIQDYRDGGSRYD